MLVTKPMNKDWKARLKSKWWATNFTGKLEPIMQPILELRDHLLTFGGEEACMEYIDEDLPKIKARGQLWPGDPRIMVEGRPSRCHENTCLLWEANKESVKIGTGYALSDDGMWRQHSWGVMTDEKGDTVIVETTVSRVAYFGFVMDDKEAQDFYDDIMW